MKLEATFSVVDLAGSSALTEAHGDEAAADLGQRFTRLVSRTLSSEGRLLKTIGDAVVVSLPGPEPGLEFLRKLWSESEEKHGFLVLRAGPLPASREGNLPARDCAQWRLPVTFTEER